MTLHGELLFQQCILKRNFNRQPLPLAFDSGFLTRDEDLPEEILSDFSRF